MANIIKKILDPSKSELKKFKKQTLLVNSFKDKLSSMTDKEITSQSKKFYERWKSGTSLNDLLPEAFATAREASKRVNGLFPYDVQVIGSCALHSGNIAEMKTGEGKTLTATMAVYLNALTHKGVHVITVNEYLSKRDAELMRDLYEFLGLTVGVNGSDLTPEEKREAFSKDITYTTNSDIGFDYLRDNMVVQKEDKVIRSLNFAIIDEVDSILIDSSRTPLIISGSDTKNESILMSDRADRFAKSLRENDYKVDEESKSVKLTNDGILKAEAFYNVENIYNKENSMIPHYIDQALRANYAYLIDKDYVVRNNEVMLIDGFTGRISEGTRLSDGLHQAIEAKENVEIQKENRSMATITYQNFFRMYSKLSGMTGTGKTEEDEFREIYNMGVIVIPTNKPILRKDLPDSLFMTEKGKFKAVVEKIKTLHKKGQPILVGTASVEKSEILSKMLELNGIPHNVLNAKNNEKEAEIVANAGQEGYVTVATNMAGRGTDIKLGPGVKEKGGLAVIGTERHESRRIDDQLRGRSGRQGDPGFSKFYLSLEDDLMIRFGADKAMMFLNDRENDDEQPITGKFLNSSISSAQKRVEGNNYDQRKQTLQYDDVIRKQRELIYKQRDIVLFEEKDLNWVVVPMMQRTIDNLIDTYFKNGKLSEEQEKELSDKIQSIFTGEDKRIFEIVKDNSKENVYDFMLDYTLDEFSKKKDTLSDFELLSFEKNSLLTIIDKLWTDHIDNIEKLRQGVTMRSYAQLNPLVEYQFEAYNAFNEMIKHIDEEITRIIIRSKITERDV